MAREIEIEDIRKVIDVEFLQQLQDGFANATGMASITTDMQGNYLTKPSNFTDFCIKYTRQSEEGCRRCVECDVKSGEETRKTGKATAYHCHAGLMDFGVPIMFAGKQLGCVVGGQVLPVKPDEEQFRKTAKELGINPDEYIAALREVMILPEERIKASADLLHMMVNTFVKFCYQQWNVKGIVKQLGGTLEKLFENMEQLNVLCKGVSDSQDLLVSEIKKVDSVSENIDSVLVLIKRIANQIKMLGLNASIESARAGEAGKGFSVVAKEIHKLSEQSKETVDEIGKFTLEISSTVNRTLEYSDENSEKTNGQIAKIEEISDEIKLVNELTESLLAIIEV